MNQKQKYSPLPVGIAIDEDMTMIEQARIDFPQLIDRTTVLSVPRKVFDSTPTNFASESIAEKYFGKARKK